MKTALMLLALTTADAPDVPSRPDWPRLEGRWAFVQVTAAVTNAPIVGRLTSETRAVGVLDLDQQGPELEMTEEICALRTSSPTPVVHTKYPEAFLSALSGNSRRARLVRDAQGNVLFRQPKTWDAKGMRLDDVASEQLPERGTDPRVFDADGDGQPGLTVRVEGLVNGDVRVVTRGWTVLEGRVGSADRIDGLVRWDAEQQVLEATNPLLSSRPSTAPHPDGSRSWFRMVRVSSDTGCSEVRAQGDALFGLTGA